MKLVGSAFLMLASLLPTRSQAQPAAADNSEEIVVTAQRSGIPVWRVHGSAGTLVLVGTIEDVAKGTDWNPDSLAAALRGADQVMFPQAVQYTGGFFSIMGARGNVRQMERLPARESLAQFTVPGDYQQLLALSGKGAVKPGFEARHPLFVAYDLMQFAKGERPGGYLSISRVDWKADPQGFVRYTINKYHLRLAPMQKESLNGALAPIAATPPRAATPCLAAAIRYAEADPSTYQARSQAWAARRVPEVVRSPAERAFTTCAAAIRNEPDAWGIKSSLFGVLRQPGTTVAVLELSTLAADGGIFDKLAAAGFEIGGPRWK